MSIDDLKRWAERCKREGRPVQAALVLQMAWEEEHQGVPWLRFMAEHNVELPKEEVN